MKNQNVNKMAVRASSLLLIWLHTHICCALQDVNLPVHHIPFYLNNNPGLRAECQGEASCQYQYATNTSSCWGYEAKCHQEDRLGRPDCSGHHKHWAKSKEKQLEEFWHSADFGLVIKHREDIKLMCKPSSEIGSSLWCTKYLRYCKAKDIYFDFTTAKIKGSRNRYREDLLSAGQVGGHCVLDVEVLKGEGEHKSPLQSWFTELEHYESLPFHPSNSSHCDVIFDKPTYLIKPDAGINMYHHFCDFVNLYVSQHINNSFDTDVNIILWDTSGNPYFDPFDLTWTAFTDHPIIPLSQLDGKKVCIKDAVFPLLARMRRGLYYNMPLIPGCKGSSLIKAFSEHTLFRLGVPQNGPLEAKIRITLLNRNTKYRNILNQEKLYSALKTDGEFEVRLVEYNRKHISFAEQLEISANSDIFIGMHGAGLTHLLFLPDWAVVMEIWHCDDPGCYSDLARLRGVHYMTWERRDKMEQEDEGHHPSGGPHAKFTNYSFDLPEFMRLVHQAASHVRGHVTFREGRGRRYSGRGDNYTHPGEKTEL